jgi:uncharacterized protein (TIGR03437 family)
MRSRRIVPVLAPLALCAFSAGPPVRNTGAPGDRTCANCHTASGVARVEIVFPSGLVYRPGELQRWRVRVSGGAVHGFQATARLGSNEERAQAGRFTAGPGTQILCGDDQPRPAAGCPESAPLEFVQHSQPLVSGEFTFDWMPPASAMGSVRIYVAGNAANNDSQRSGDVIALASYTLQPAPAGVASIGMVANLWSGVPGAAPNTWVAVFGTDLPAQPAVTLAGRPATVAFADAGRIHLLAPNLELGNAGLEVTGPGVRLSAPVSVSAYQPALYVHPQRPRNGRAYLTAVALDGTYVGDSKADPRVRRRARPGEILQFFGTGFGAGVEVPVRIRLGPVALETIGYPAGPGLFQFNLPVPASLAAGEHEVAAEIAGTSSPSSFYLAVE